MCCKKIAYRTGQIVGLPLGGLLAHPARNFTLFQTPFWYEYPFALPCFVASVFAACFVIMGYFALPEVCQKICKLPPSAVLDDIADPRVQKEINRGFTYIRHCFATG